MGKNSDRERGGGGGGANLRRNSQSHGDPAVAVSDTALNLGKCALEDSRTRATGDLGFDSSLILLHGKREK